MQPRDEARWYEAYLAGLPEDARQRLQEPADEDIVPGEFSPLRRCLLPAKDRPATPSRFLSVSLRSAITRDGAPHKFTAWHRMPEVTRRMGIGGGRGLYAFKEGPSWLSWLQRRPLVKIAHSPSRFPELWAVSEALVASPEACELIQRFEPAIETVDIECSFDDGTSREGYVLLDFIGRRYPYDYLKSDVTVYLSDGRRRMELGSTRTVRDDIPSNVHAFWERPEGDLFLSRELAEHIERLAPGQFSYHDDNLGELGSIGRAANTRAARECQGGRRVQAPGPKPAEVSERLVPLLRSCDLLAAERLLVEALQATPVSPYHVACNLRIETAPQRVAEYFDSFLVGTRREQRVAAVYCDSRVLPRSEEVEYENARKLTQALVLVKFQKMLQDALPSMQHMDVPLLAAVHDWYGDYVVEIRPAVAA